MCTKELLPFLKYLEISDPGLLSYTTFLANIEKRLFHTFVVLNTSGVENLLTICHGDSKPGNFMLRKKSCEDNNGLWQLEAALFDWQAGFLGSVSNDLMKLLPPFLEVPTESRGPGSIVNIWKISQMCKST